MFSFGYTIGFVLTNEPWALRSLVRPENAPEYLLIFINEEFHMSQKPAVYTANTVPCRKIRQQTRYLPDSFALAVTASPGQNMASKLMHKAATLAIADYALHQSLVMSGEFVTWQAVRGLSFLRHRSHSLTLGWRISADEKPIIFTQTHWESAFAWLVKAGYLTTNATTDEIDPDAVYTPSMGLIFEFYKTQGITLAFAAT